MTDYFIDAIYSAGALTRVTLPDDITWDDIADWYVKWDTLHYKLKEFEEWNEIPLDSDALEAIDWKRPSSVTVYPVDEYDQPNFDIEIASYEY